MTYIFAFIFFYVLYKFVVKIVWPIFKVTRTVRNTMKGMQQPNQSSFKNTSSSFSNNSTRFQKSTQSVNNSSINEKKGDYIDFEEIK